MLYDTFAELDRELSRLGGLLPAVTEGGWRAPTDIRREGDRYVAEVDLPGVDPSSIDVTYEAGWLTVRAERSSSRDEEDGGWVVRERSHASAVRRFNVGRAVDVDAITADYTDGVLTLSLPLAEQVKPRKVAITGATTARELGAGTGTGETADQGDDQGKAQAAHSGTSATS